MVVAVIIGLTVLCAAAEGQELKKIKIGYPAISYNQMHIWVAKEAGLFKKHGLDAEVIFFRGGQVATQALVAGDPPIVNIGTVVQANLQGHDLALIASSENAYNYSVITRPNISRIEQLKGRRLGVSGFGSASHNASLILLRRMSLEPNKDVAVIVAGPTLERLASLDAGKIDATVLTPSEIPRAKKQGFVEIFDMNDLGVEVQEVFVAFLRERTRPQSGADGQLALAVAKEHGALSPRVITRTPLLASAWWSVNGCRKCAACSAAWACAMVDA